MEKQMGKIFPLHSDNFHPFGKLIGLNFTIVENGTSQCKLEINKTLFNPHKVLHGGVIYSMADTGMGGALYSLLKEEEQCATIEIKINYFQPVFSGSLTANTKVINKGKKIASLESEIFNNNSLIAKAMGTYSIFKAVKSGDF